MRKFLIMYSVWGFDVIDGCESAAYRRQGLCFRGRADNERDTVNILLAYWKDDPYFGIEFIESITWEG